MLWRNYLILIMTLSGALPPPLCHPPIAIEPYYLYAIAGKFPVQVIPVHRNTSPPPMGAGLVQGGRSSLKREFFQNRNIFMIVPVSATVMHVLSWLLRSSMHTPCSLFVATLVKTDPVSRIILNKIILKDPGSSKT